MTPALPPVSLPRFEGPLDLLLALIRRNELPIRDFPIAEVTRQYLDYLEAAEHSSLELGAEFAYVAATLIQIKARSLLPRDPEIASREPDPKEDLIRQLLDRDQVRKAAEFLQQRWELNAAVWSNPVVEEPADSEDAAGGDSTGRMNLLQIATLARKALEAARAHRTLEPVATGVTIEEMIHFVEEFLSATGPGVAISADALFRRRALRDEWPTLFLAMLEMAKEAELRIEQSEAFAPIYLSRVA